MRNSNVKNEYRSMEVLEDKDSEKIPVKNDCYVTRYIYEGTNGSQAGTSTVVDYQHSNQKRRYYNTRRGI
jgi:hypothetical protein